MSKEFKGTTWSYKDARERMPQAWRKRVVSGEFENGDTWSRVEWDDVSGKGLGHFERDGKSWVYVRPNGYASRVLVNYGQPEPPVLPKPVSEHAKCGCHESSHNCGACGKPYFIEIHGMADGYCTYCYHSG